MGPHESFTIIVASQKSHVVEELERTLSGAHGYSLLVASSGEAALKLLHPEVSVIIIDVLNRADQISDFVENVSLRAPDTQVIFLNSGPKVEVDPATASTHWVITRTGSLEELRLSVAKACVVWELSRENRALRSSFGLPQGMVNFVSDSPRSRETIEKASQVAKLTSTVLITGESGTGKTTLARLIHQRGPRSAFPFVALSCAAIPRDLLEAELFGHEKGAFTGASGSRPGLIEMAEGGTLFLDEIGDLPLDVQPKLLTFLQDKMMKRIGAVRMRQADVRLIAATNKPLAPLCARGEFRQDLFYRLNVLSIEIPPLRERIEDIPRIIQQTLERIALMRGVTRVTIDSAAIQFLCKLPWPGNVRELENLLERVTAFGERSEIGLSDILKVNENSIIQTDNSSSQNYVGKTLSQIEQEAIRERIELCNGNKTAAAEQLGISVKSIYNKLKPRSKRTRKR